MEISTNHEIHQSLFTRSGLVLFRNKRNRAKSTKPFQMWPKTFHMAIIVKKKCLFVLEAIKVSRKILMNGSKSHDIKTRWGFARVNEEITCQVRIRYYKNMQISEKDNFSEISHAKKIFLKACVLKTEDDRVACLWCYHLFQNWSDKNIISNKKGRKKKPQSSSKGGEKFWTFKLANILLHDGCVLYQCQNGFYRG